MPASTASPCRTWRGPAGGVRCVSGWSRMTLWPRDHLWCGRHDDRAHQRPCHGAAAAQPVLARRLIERSRVAETLGEWRGATAVHREALEQILLRVSEMVCQLPQLREMDINPIIVDDMGAVAVDARIVIDHAPQSASGSVGQYGHLAILPYPARYEQIWPLRGGVNTRCAPSSQTMRRCSRPWCRTSRPRAVTSASSRPWRNPADDAGAFHADRLRPRDGPGGCLQGAQGRAEGEITETERIVGVSRYITNPDQSSCEFALVVADDFSGKGLGSRLMPASWMWRAREGPGRDRRAGAGQQPRDAQAHAQSGVLDQGLCG